METTVWILPHIFKGFILLNLDSYFYSYLFDYISCNIFEVTKLSYHYTISITFPYFTHKNQLLWAICFCGAICVEHTYVWVQFRLFNLVYWSTCKSSCQYQTKWLSFWDLIFKFKKAKVVNTSVLQRCFSNLCFLILCRFQLFPVPFLKVIGKLEHLVNNIGSFYKFLIACLKLI